MKNSRYRKTTGTIIDEKVHESRFRNGRRREDRSVNHRYRRRILLLMAVVMLFSLYTNITATYRWGSAQMQSKASAYENDLSQWVVTQKSILDMFVSVISTNPEMLDDYRGTVSYLDRITEQYPAISVSYIANPNMKYTTIMNTGWKPGPEVKVDERPWYVGAVKSDTGWSITAPYYDQQTGGYCVTMSEQVHDAKTGEFLGVFGIDFFMDDLVAILGNSYTDEGYAFLVDTEGNIVNHPNSGYQMSEEVQTSVSDLPYGKVKADGRGTGIIRDYDGSVRILLAKADEISRFSVYVVSDAWIIYGRVIIYGLVCLVVFLICMFLMSRLLSGMIDWQEEVNRRLEKAARTDAMTGLMNKTSAEETISRRMENGSGALLVLDLDNFKLVNDLYSHEMGDRILIRMAELIQSTIRENDIAGRIGGDEFIAYCESLTDVGVLAAKTEELNRELLKTAREYMGNDMEIPLGCSVGAVLVPEGGREYGILFSKADQALHQAKTDGKHVLRMHRDQREVKEDKDSEISRLQTVFGERNRKPTAMVADRNTFRDVYRFMMRYAANCACGLHMIVFNLQTPQDGGAEDGQVERADRFVEVAAQNLRSCDVILKYNAKQILVLLVDADAEGYLVPVERILNAWEKEGESDVTISFQHEQMDSGSGVADGSRRG